MVSYLVAQGPRRGLQVQNPGVRARCSGEDGRLEAACRGTTQGSKDRAAGTSGISHGDQKSQSEPLKAIYPCLHRE